MSDWQVIGSVPLDYSWQVVAKFTETGRRLWWERARWNVRAGAWKTAGGTCDPTHWFPLPPLDNVPRRPQCEVCGVVLTPEDLSAGSCPYCKQNFSEYPPEGSRCTNCGMGL